MRVSHGRPARRTRVCGRSSTHEYADPYELYHLAVLKTCDVNCDATAQKLPVVTPIDRLLLVIGGTQCKSQ